MCTAVLLEDTSDPFHYRSH